jgi:hypothetical protein
MSLGSGHTFLERHGGYVDMWICEKEMRETECSYKSRAEHVNVPRPPRVPLSPCLLHTEEAFSPEFCDSRVFLIFCFELCTNILEIYISAYNSLPPMPRFP